MRDTAVDRPVCVTRGGRGRRIRGENVASAGICRAQRRSAGICRAQRRGEIASELRGSDRSGFEFDLEAWISLDIVDHLVIPGHEFRNRDAAALGAEFPQLIQAMNCSTSNTSIREFGVVCRAFGNLRGGKRLC